MTEFVNRLTEIVSVECGASRIYLNPFGNGFGTKRALKDAMKIQGGSVGIGLLAAGFGAWLVWSVWQLANTVIH